MTVFALVFSLALVGLLVGLMVTMPSIVPRTLPLGVAVPHDRIDDTAVAAAIRRFRIGQVVAGGIAILLAIVLALLVPLAGAIAPVISFLVLSAIVYVTTRRRIVAAKRAGGWYDDVPVRLTAEVTAPAHHRPPLLWPVIAVVLLVAAAAIGIVLYPHLPDPYRVHRTFDGVPDRTAAKSVGAVFGPLLIGAAIAVVFAVISAVISRSATRVSAGDGALAAAQRRGVLAALVAELSAAIAGGMSVLSVVTWLAPASKVAVVASLVVVIALIVLVLIVATVRLRAVTRGTTPRIARGSAHDGPDDDRYWKAGLLYVNRDDPALWVPKRFGIGWTINAGHPAGILIIALAVVVVVGIIVAASLGIRAR